MQMCCFVLCKWEILCVCVKEWSCVEMFVSDHQLLMLGPYMVELWTDWSMNEVLMSLIHRSSLHMNVMMSLNQMQNNTEPFIYHRPVDITQLCCEWQIQMWCRDREHWPLSLTHNSYQSHISVIYKVSFHLISALHFKLLSYMLTIQQCT